MCLSIAIHRPNDVITKGEHAGFQYVVTHNGHGYRCGYVRVPAGHPWHGKDEDDACMPNGDYPVVHGGLTFAQPDVHCGKGGEDDAWWFGFDCAHGGTDAPDPTLSDMASRLYGGMKPIGRETIKTTEYVEEECRSLCEQARTVAGGVS